MCVWYFDIGLYLVQLHNPAGLTNGHFFHRSAQQRDRKASKCPSPNTAGRQSHSLWKSDRLKRDAIRKRDAVVSAGHRCSAAAWPDWPFQPVTVSRATWSGCWSATSPMKSTNGLDGQKNEDAKLKEKKQTPSFYFSSVFCPFWFLVMSRSTWDAVVSLFRSNTRSMNHESVESKKGARSRIVCVLWLHWSTFFDLKKEQCNVVWKWISLTFMTFFWYFLSELLKMIRHTFFHRKMPNSEGFQWKQRIWGKAEERCTEGTSKSMHSNDIRFDISSGCYNINTIKMLDYLFNIAVKIKQCIPCTAASSRLKRGL